MIKGNLRKLQGTPATPVEYFLPVGETGVVLTPGQRLSLRFSGRIHCVACGRVTKKSYSQGHCYPCSQRLAACDLCIVKPERCHYARGTCREPAWGEANCMQPHYVYLANASGVKVGITRAVRIPTRWIDQGAMQALPIFRVQSRYSSGLLEIALAKQVADKTDWRKLLKGDPPPVDLAAVRDRLFTTCGEDIDAVRAQFPPAEIEALRAEETVTLRYPVQNYPAKIIALNLDKTPTVDGILMGIKGQYLIFDYGVLNVRKFSGYEVEVSVENA